MNFQAKTMFYCTRQWWLNGRTPNQPQEQASAKPEALHGLSADTGQTFPQPLFVIHAYSLEQARALVAAMVVGEAIVVGPVSLEAGR